MRTDGEVLMVFTAFILALVLMREVVYIVSFFFFMFNRLNIQS